MKSFSKFLEEASLASFQAKRLGLVGDEHGGWYNKRTGEFEAKTVGGRLRFYNKRQRFGQQDPRQTNREKNLSKSTPQNSPVIGEQELREMYIMGEIFKEGDTVQSLVTEMVGKIIRRGTNHLICVTEDGEMFKSWIKDVVEVTKIKKNFLGNVNVKDRVPIKKREKHLFKKDLNGDVANANEQKNTNVSGVPADQRLVGTDEYRKYTMRMAKSEKIDNFNIGQFINKYRKK